MGKSSRNRITRTTDRPARRATRPAAPTAAATPAEVIVEAPVAEIMVDPAAAPAATQDVIAPSHAEVARLAFRFFAESGFAHGHALDHWLRAEAELSRG